MLAYQAPHYIFVIVCLLQILNAAIDLVLYGVYIQTKATKHRFMGALDLHVCGEISEGIITMGISQLNENSYIHNYGNYITCSRSTYQQYFA